MDWSQHSIPAMRLEPRFDDRIVPAFCERPKSIPAMVAEAVAQNPDGEALVCGDRRMTWHEVAQQSAQIAAGLQKLGLQRGDRVAVLLGNRIEFVLTMLGAAHAGLVTVLLSTRQQKPEIAYVLTDCGARLLIHEAALADRVPDAGAIPDVTHRIAVDDDPRLSRFSELADHAPLQAPAEVGEEDTAIILYTSGTTGRPKGAMLAHCNIIHSAMVFVSCLKLTAADRSIAAVPLGHVTGVVANIMTMVRCAGALIIMAEFKAAEYLKMAARERVTYTVMVPAMYNLCLLQPDFDGYDLSSWRIGGFGGAPMPIATIEKLDAKIPGLKLMNCYGATETTSPSTMMPGELTAGHIDSVGLPCPGAQIVVYFAPNTDDGFINALYAAIRDNLRRPSVVSISWGSPENQSTAQSIPALLAQLQSQNNPLLTQGFVTFGRETLPAPHRELGAVRLGRSPARGRGRCGGRRRRGRLRTGSHQNAARRRQVAQKFAPSAYRRSHRNSPFIL